MDLQWFERILQDDKLCVYLNIYSCEICELLIPSMLMYNGCVHKWGQKGAENVEIEYLNKLYDILESKYLYSVIMLPNKSFLCGFKQPEWF